MRSLRKPLFLVLVALVFYPSLVSWPMTTLTDSVDEASMKTEFDEIERDVIKILESISVEAEKGGDWKDSNWTKAIKEKMINLAHSKNLLVACHSVEGADFSEWLYDLVWYEDSGGTLSDIRLIMEIEWLTDLENLTLDFHKLMVGKSDYRVFVFQNNNIEDGIEHLRNNIISFKKSMSGERYLFAGWDKNLNKFIFRSFIVP